MELGISLGLTRLGRSGGFSPASLFTAGTVGAWYDPSDYSTLFQTINGTTPVTAVEQPVGLMLDKSQGLSGSGSQLVTNGDFSSPSTTGWQASGGGSFSVVSNRLQVTGAGATGTGAAYTLTTIVGMTYTVSFDVVLGTATIVDSQMSLTVAAGASIGPSYQYCSVNGTYKYSFVATATTTYFQFHPRGTGNTASVDNFSVISLGNGNHAVAPNDLSRPVLRARYNTLLATETLATQSVTTLAASYKLAFSGAGSITLSGTATGTYSAGTNTITCTAGTLTLTVSGTVTQADLRLASTATSMPAYQRVTTSTDYATAGFLPYLAFDGSDDSFGTNSINFSATDKMSVCAGVTKLSDANIGMVTEFSTVAGTSSGAFALRAPYTAGTADYGFQSTGTTSVNITATSYVSPITNVVTGLGNISAPFATLRVNGAQVGQITSSQGTGNYGNYPLFIGRRNNASIPLNGRIYSLLIVGKTLSASELSATEAWVAAKTGITI